MSCITPLIPKRPLLGRWLYDLAEQKTVMQLFVQVSPCGSGERTASPGNERSDRARLFEEVREIVFVVTVFLCAPVFLNRANELLDIPILQVIDEIKRGMVLS